jgi:branched-chain amino acid transport system ATP-binding protein
LLNVNNVDAFYDDIQILYEISLEVEEGEIVSLVGGNGSGKSTLINTITGIMKPRSGEIFFRGDRIDGLKTEEIVAVGLIQVPEGRQLFGKLTVRENLEMGAVNKRAKPERNSTLKKVIELFPILGSRSNQLAGLLSGGEQQMLSIGRALMGLPKLLILDEPSLGLAPIIIKNIFGTIKDINRHGHITILLSEQNLQASLMMSHRGYVLENGRIVLQGTGKELLENEHTRKAYLGM